MILRKLSTGYKFHSVGVIKIIGLFLCQELFDINSKRKGGKTTSGKSKKSSSGRKSTSSSRKTSAGLQPCYCERCHAEIARSCDNKVSQIKKKNDLSPLLIFIFRKFPPMKATDIGMNFVSFVMAAKCPWYEMVTLAMTRKFTVQIAWTNSMPTLVFVVKKRFSCTQNHKK